MLRKLRRRWKSQRGQTTTEYLLVLAFIIISMVAVASNLYPFYKAGVDKLAQDIVDMMDRGQF